MTNDSTESPAKAWLKNRKTSKGGPLVLSLLTLAGILLLGTIVVVSVSQMEPEPEFKAKKSVYLPQRELEHKAAVSEFQQAASSPTTVQKLSAESMLSDSPPLPETPQTEFTPVQNDSPIGEAQSMFGTSGLMGAMQGLSTNASSASFLGVEDKAEKLLIVFDISKTVVNSVKEAGLSMEDIKKETRKLIKSLNANTLFGMIQHSRNFDVFQQYLIPATVGNKELTQKWLDSEFRTSGSGRGWQRLGNENGIEAVMKRALQMEPDVIFLISDGGYWRSHPNNEPVPFEDLEDTVEDAQEQLPEPTRIHFIGFGVDRSDRKGYIGSKMRKITRKYDGEFKKFEE